MSTKYTAQAMTNREYRIKSIIICAVLMVLALTALGLAVYNIIKLKFLFVLGYLIGIILACAVVIMRMNTAFATKIMADRKTVVFYAWENMFVPYKADFSFKFLRDFVPAKTKTEKILISDITDIYIGTRSYILRSSDDGFSDAILSLISEDDMKKIAKSDLFCIKAASRYYVMSIDNFDTRAIGKVVSTIIRANESIELHTSSKKYRTYLKRQ